MRKSTGKLILIMLLIMTVCCSCGEKEAPYIKGSVVADNYFSDWLGLQWRAPKDVDMLSQEELAAIMTKELKSIYADEADEVLDYTTLGSVYEMMAVNDKGSANIVIMAEKLGDKKIDIDEYIELLGKELAAVNAQYVEASQSEQEIAGQVYTALCYTVTEGELEMKQQYYLHKQADRMAAIIITYIDEADKDMLLGAFSPYSLETLQK